MVIRRDVFPLDEEILVDVLTLSGFVKVLFTIFDKGGALDRGDLVASKYNESGIVNEGVLTAIREVFKKYDLVKETKVRSREGRGGMKIILELTPRGKELVLRIRALLAEMSKILG